jgi:UDP-N-acetylglucosamine 2-epimerase (non-hydrolysing)
MKVMSVFGTRPEMIKMWSTLKKLDELPGFEHIMVHTGQNYTPELKDFFFNDLELRAPDHQLAISTASYGKEVADVVRMSEELFQKERPDALLILGDTYSCLSVLPAAHYGIKVFHMEAGLRAYDRRMPEQRNRMVVDRLSDYNLVYNQYHRENLLREGMHPSKIIVMGNPTFEVIRHFEKKIDASKIMETLGLKPKGYLLVTAHRSENVDHKDTLAAILDALARLHKDTGLEIVYPAHPRAMNKIEQFGLKVDPSIKFMKPLGYYDYNKLFKHAACSLSDSGTSPEEAFYYKVPCVSLRQTTERFETIEGGAHIVGGSNADNIFAAVKQSIALGAGGVWGARYDMCEDLDCSRVVVNTIRSAITNYF